MKNVPDPFKDARRTGPVLKCPVHGEDIAMLLRHGDVRAAASDWQTFSSDAPFRVPIPSEEAVRSIRQLPIETNPPEHSEWRAIVQPFFDRPKQPEVMARVEALIDDLLGKALAGGPLEVVGDFALPLQSRALTYLLKVPESEADTWIGWAAANMDGVVFDRPEEIQLTRKPNPHLSFGFGSHLCLGAPHARLIVRSLLKALCGKVKAVDVLAADPNVEREAAYTREVGFESLTIQLTAIS